MSKRRVHHDPEEEEWIMSAAASAYAKTVNEY
jgi:hypothetical protein